ncbi:hypothetical protein NDU88_006590 [Pleurodeles waltl]|uniref:Uncharacterized protein n=1 Tax=Pleurodeles waltl TaxID=8319 RepID=A0AAV7LSF4_PLEWA|nr:hypothetical protein NDU88_006590 [Pleurodeles waltl]
MAAPQARPPTGPDHTSQRWSSAPPETRLRDSPVFGHHPEGGGECGRLPQAVVAEGESGAELIQKAQCEVATQDISRPQENGWEFREEAARRAPRAPRSSRRNRISENKEKKARPRSRRSARWDGTLELGGWEGRSSGRSLAWQAQPHPDSSHPPLRAGSRRRVELGRKAAQQQ